MVWDTGSIPTSLAHVLKCPRVRLDPTLLLVIIGYRLWVSASVELCSHRTWFVHQERPVLILTQRTDAIRGPALQLSIGRGVSALQLPVLAATVIWALRVKKSELWQRVKPHQLIRDSALTHDMLTRSAGAVQNKHGDESDYAPPELWYFSYLHQDYNKKAPDFIFIFSSVV